MMIDHPKLWQGPSSRDSRHEDPFVRIKVHWFCDSRGPQGMIPCHPREAGKRHPSFSGLGYAGMEWAGKRELRCVAQVATASVMTLEQNRCLCPLIQFASC